MREERTLYCLFSRHASAVTRPLSIEFHGRDQPGDVMRNGPLTRAPARGVIWADRKLIRTRHGDELYLLREDPHELRNLIEAEPERAARLARELVAPLVGRPSAVPVELDPDERRALRELGYLE